MCVSHKTIHRSLFIQARGVLKKELIGHLRSRRRMRRAQRASTTGQPLGQIIDGLSIRDEPSEVKDRAIPGHWEGGLITGSQNTHIATLVERQLRFTMLVKVPGKDTASVVTALSRAVRTLPATLRRSLTWDRGMELAQHKRFTVAADVQVYCCDPPKSVAAGYERKYESSIAPVFSERHQPLTPFPSRLRHHRVTVESTATEDIGISDTGGYTRGGCCDHRLNLPFPILQTADRLTGIHPNPASSDALLRVVFFTAASSGLSMLFEPFMNHTPSHETDRLRHGSLSQSHRHV